MKTLKQVGPSFAPSRQNHTHRYQYAPSTRTFFLHCNALNYRLLAPSVQIRSAQHVLAQGCTLPRKDSVQSAPVVRQSSWRHTLRLPIPIRVTRSMPLKARQRILSNLSIMLLLCFLQQRVSVRTGHVQSGRGVQQHNRRLRGYAGGCFRHGKKVCVIIPYSSLRICHDERYGMTAVHGGVEHGATVGGDISIS